jgi:hypothetical protein
MKGILLGIIVGVLLEILIVSNQGSLQFMGGYYYFIVLTIIPFLSSLLNKNLLAKSKFYFFLSILFTVVFIIFFTQLYLFIYKGKLITDLRIYLIVTLGSIFISFIVFVMSVMWGRSCIRLSDERKRK